MYNERVMLHKLHQAREAINAGVGGKGVYLSKRECESIVMAIDEAVRRLTDAVISPDAPATGNRAVFRDHDDEGGQNER